MSKREKMVGLSAFILIILLVVLIAPANAGVSPTVGRAIGDAANASAFIGETNLRFVDGTGASIPSGKLKSTWEGSNINIPFDTPFDSSSKAVKDNLIEGDYDVIVDNRKTTSVTFYSPANQLKVETKVNGEDFSWVTRGGNITFNATTKLNMIKGMQPNNITYKLLDTQGVQMYAVHGKTLTNISVDSTGGTSIIINTTGLDIGTYTLSIETDPDTNNGLDAEGPSVSFDVRSRGITIDAKPPKEIVTKDIVFSIETTPHTHVMLNVTWGLPSKVFFKNEQGKEVGSTILGVADKNGKLERKAYFEAIGSYEITAIEFIANTTDSIFVEIAPYTVELKTDKSTYSIGEEVVITGSATAGDKLVLKIDDEVVKWDDDDITSSKYSWKTEGETLGSHEIAMWVVGTPESLFSDPFYDLPDASVTIILLRGGLNAEVDKEFVAQGDDFTIKGTVPGRDRVDVMTIGPKGGSGHGLDPNDIVNETNGALNAPGLTYLTSGISTDGTFETDKIKVDRGADTGMYQIAVLNYGKDGVWGTKTGTNNLLKAITHNYSISLVTKTQEEILAYLMDNTVGQPGSDDLLCVVTLKVENGFIRLDAIENVLLGTELKVTGISNREVETQIVVTVEGPTNLKPQVIEVKADTKTFYNTFETSFGTATAKIGEYLVTAKDNDGHEVTTTLNIILTDEPVINFSTPALPTVEEPANQSDNESVNVTLAEALKRPVFKVAFIVAGLLVVGGAAWVILSRKEEPSGLARPRRGGLASAKRKKPQWPPQKRKKRL
ncbi:MAG: hypothetical protein ACNYVW_08460 [Methanosarcinales archaeon]